jgi:DNA-binding MarR family transcriptional regulator
MAVTPLKTALSPSKRKAAKAADLERIAADNRAGPDLGCLATSLGYLLKRAQLAVFQDFAGAFAEFDIRPAQFSVLTLIERNPGLKQIEIGRALGIKRTNFVPLLDALETRGLATRRAVPSDRRSYALYLTERGATALRRMYEIQAEHERHLAEIVGAEGRALLLDLLGKLATEVGGGDIEADEENGAAARSHERRSPGVRKRTRG